MPLVKIVSGGQTGVDRGALDAALAAGFPCGGWCPEGRLAEDGVIADCYPTVVLSGAGYEERTLQNVLDSDGTAILHPGKLEGGTRLTAEHCARHGRPHALIDASGRTPDQAAAEIAAFVKRERIAVLNVAGPRASKWPGARDYACAVVSRLLSSRS
jgi:hypothetical protein